VTALDGQRTSGWWLGQAAAPVLSAARLAAIGWWLQLKIRSRSAFDLMLAVVYPLIFASAIFLLFRQTATGAGLIGVAVGASAIGVWSATTTTASDALQAERRQGTLELLVLAPRLFPLVILPITLSMTSTGLYSLVTTLLWGRIVFGIPIMFHDPVGFVCAVAAIVVAIGLIGFLQAVTMVRFRAAWAIGAALDMPVWLICGFLVPLSVLPAWVRPVAWILPPTWGVYALHAAAFGGSPWLDILICVAIASGYAVVGTMWSFRLLDAARAAATLALT
jgi:ABC-2 type transport system permease protein